MIILQVLKIPFFKYFVLHCLGKVCAVKLCDLSIGFRVVVFCAGGLFDANE